ncbi:MAG: enhanced serine sensitivity protein SseB C-terminal domain-containing protein [Cocleimonas sp.]|nr:enhanced serine sensitivity protein SseB C-terminal domain-containing protein [Cocleimonas sp.]
MMLPSNPLEQALFTSASDETQTPKFYDLLLESNIYILGSVSNKEEETFEINDDQEFDIQHWEKDEDQSPIIPFFTSLQALQQAIPEDSPYLEIPAIAFLEMTMGVPLVLNPNSDYGLEFDADDVVILLGMNTDEVKTGEFDGDEDGMTLGKLDNLPPNLSNAMKTAFANFPEIDTAYMAAILVPLEDKKAHLLVGIEGQGDLDKVIIEAADSISEDDNDSDFEMFDFYAMSTEDDEVISNFLRDEDTAFYHGKPKQMH